MSSFNTDVLVIGGGPGGYTAAFRLKAHGIKTVIVDERGLLGGVCLHEGCIPTKTYLHAAHTIDAISDLQKAGVSCEQISIDPNLMREHKAGIVKRLTSGLAHHAKALNVEVIKGKAAFKTPFTVLIKEEEGEREITFKKAIIATGSRAIDLPCLPKSDLIFDAKKALELPIQKGELLIIGAGIIGLEMAEIYSAMGCDVTVVELIDEFLPMIDESLTRPLYRKFKKSCKKIKLGVKVGNINQVENGFNVCFSDCKESVRFDAILSAVGRRPNSDSLNLESLEISLSDRDEVIVNQHGQTNHEHIFAIGDVTQGAMLAHRAISEGEYVADFISNKAKAGMSDFVIPSVLYTSPELAWVGLSEKMAIDQKIDYQKIEYPWMRNGRAFTLGAEKGMTQILFDSKTRLILGATLLGVDAGELIAGLTLAIKQKVTIDDLATTIHPHPTLSETINFPCKIK